MKPQLIVSLLVLSCSLWAVNTQSACFAYNGGFFYMAAELELNCIDVCQAYGGFNAEYTRHTGNAVGMHFTPEKSNGYNWEPIECSSVDMPQTNWGANGQDPDPTFSHPACYVFCACNLGMDDCEGDICANVAVGGNCSFRYYNEDDALTYVTGQCNTAGKCIAPGASCKIADPTPCTRGVFDKDGNCTVVSANEGVACPMDGVDSDCNKCVSGVCAIAVNQACSDGDASTINDVCSVDGTCSGSAPVAAPVVAPVATPVAKNSVATFLTAPTFALLTLFLYTL